MQKLELAWIGHNLLEDLVKGRSVALKTLLNEAEQMRAVLPISALQLK